MKYLIINFVNYLKKNELSEVWPRFNRLVRKKQA